MDEPVEIIVRDNGSLRINGNFVIKDGKGNAFDLAGRTSVSLCRCGQSKDKPFCDSTHKKIGFESVVEARRLAPPAQKP
jgi:CDGSH-type Zn-finger protein